MSKLTTEQIEELQNDSTDSNKEYVDEFYLNYLDDEAIETLENNANKILRNYNINGDILKRKFKKELYNATIITENVAPFYLSDNYYLNASTEELKVIIENENLFDYKVLMELAKRFENGIKNCYKSEYLSKKYIKNANNTKALISITTISINNTYFTKIRFWACFELFQRYDNGITVKKDLEKATTYLEKAYDIATNYEPVEGIYNQLSILLNQRRRYGIGSKFNAMDYGSFLSMDYSEWNPYYAEAILLYFKYYTSKHNYKMMEQLINIYINNSSYWSALLLGMGINKISTTEKDNPIISLLYIKSLYCFNETNNGTLKFFIKNMPNLKEQLDKINPYIEKIENIIKNKNNNIDVYNYINLNKQLYFKEITNNYFNLPRYRLINKCKNHDVEAMLQLAFNYSFAHKAKQSNEKSEYYLNLASENNSIFAIHQLGNKKYRLLELNVKCNILLLEQILKLNDDLKDSLNSLISKCIEMYNNILETYVL